MSSISDELYERFKTNLEAVNGNCLRCSSADLGKTIADTFGAAGIPDACVFESPELKEAGVVDAMKAAGMTVYTDHLRLNAETAKGGVSLGQAGIAELGTMMQFDDAADGRIVSTMCEYYIGVIKGDTVVDSYDDMFDKLSEMDPFPNFVGFVTGPSRTADIECVGTVGVHGPIQITVIIVDD